MDYNEHYSLTYNLTTNAIRRALISKFKQWKANKRPFNSQNNKFLHWANDFKNKRFEGKFKTLEPKAFSLFINRWELYEGKELDVIQLALENEVKSAYQNSGYGSYDNFISELAKYEAFKKIITHFHSHYNYYKLIYSQGKYEYFYLKNFEGYSYESSKEYNEMCDIEYPDRVKEKARVKQKKRASCSSDLSDFLESLSDDERMLMVNVFYNALLKANEKHKLTLTSFMKFIKIVGSYTDASIFYESAQSNTLYSKANKGLDYYNNTTKQINLINSTLVKIENHDLGFIKDSLKMKLAKINNSK